MQEDGDMQNYYSTVFTLKSGVRIKILHKKPYDEVVKITFTDTKRLEAKGFISTPLIIKKFISIRCDEIVAIEITNELHLFHVHWEDTELDTRSFHSEDCDCPVCNYLKSYRHSAQCDCDVCTIRREELKNPVLSELDGADQD